MKLNYFLLFFLFTISINSQTNSYIDSIQNIITNLPKKEKLKKIVEIPYDKLINDITNSEKLLIDGTSLSVELNDSLSLAEIYFKLSQINAYKDKIEQKIDYILKSIRIYENLGETLKAGVAYGQLGYTIKWNDNDLAFHYMRKSIELIESTKDTTLIDPVYDNYGTLLLLNKRFDSAIYYHNKSLVLKKELKDSLGLGFGYANLANAYTELKEFNTAKKFIDSSLAIRKKINDSYGIAVSYTHTGDLYYAEQKYSEAIKNYKKSIDLANKHNYQHLEKYCAELLTNCYLNLNDYKNAFSYNNIFQTLKDSAINSQTNTRVAELQIEFETEKKEKEISQQKEQLLQKEIEIQDKKLSIILLAAALLFFSVISFGLYSRQKHKKREYLNLIALKEAQTYNKLQDERLRISRDLHDNIGAQLTFIISTVDNLNFLTDASNTKLKNKLSEIVQFANTTIGQLRDTIWALNKENITFEDFQLRLLSFIEKAKKASNSIQFNYNSTVKTNIIFSSIKGINIFRVFQEAINNSIKYANATAINITILENNNKITFEISDNGKGFDINNVKLGNGLKNMQHRIHEINETIEIHSAINNGTSIKINCTINRSNAV